MKKCIILLTIIATLCITSCKSNEEKANELIRAELSKTLYDFDSYQPVETIVKEAKNTAFNNEKCWQWASLANLYLDECHKHIESSKQAQEYMEIYTPSYCCCAIPPDMHKYLYFGNFTHAVEQAQRRKSDIITFKDVGKYSKLKKLILGLPRAFNERSECESQQENASHLNSCDIIGKETKEVFKR